MTPPETVTGAAANVPAKKRQATRAAIEFDSAHPKLKSVKQKKDTKKIGRLPKTSESGAQIRGPST
jgi:hypothetical protein